MKISLLKHHTCSPYFTKRRREASNPDPAQPPSGAGPCGTIAVAHAPPASGAVPALPSPAPLLSSSCWRAGPSFQSPAHGPSRHTRQARAEIRNFPLLGFLFKRSVQAASCLSSHVWTARRREPNHIQVFLLERKRFSSHRIFHTREILLKTYLLSQN